VAAQTQGSAGRREGAEGYLVRLSQVRIKVIEFMEYFVRRSLSPLESENLRGNFPLT
jgi:hypothetical protein